MAVSDENTTDTSSNKRVRERLLDVADELFCEHGFDGTSVRDLAAAAKCNIASVNYYFGGKDKLYVEVWRRLLLQMREVRLESIRNVMSQSGGNPSLEELLRSFVYSFIGPLTDKGRARQLRRLMAREMLDQHLPPSMFGEEVIAPTMAAMEKALVKTCPTLEKSKVPLVLFSIAGQLVHTIHIKAMFEQVDSPELPKFDLAELVDHIVKFSAAGIQAYAETRTK